MTDHMQYILALTWGWQEWMIILVIALLIFGGKKLPELARSLGKSLNEFKRGVNEAKETKDDLADDVKELKDEVVNQAKDAAGLDDSEKTE